MWNLEKIEKPNGDKRWARRDEKWEMLSKLKINPCNNNIKIIIASVRMHRSGHDEEAKFCCCPSSPFVRLFFIHYIKTSLLFVGQHSRKYLMDIPLLCAMQTQTINLSVCYAKLNFNWRLQQSNHFWWNNSIFKCIHSALAPSLLAFSLSLRQLLLLLFGWCRMQIHFLMSCKIHFNQE